MDFQLLEGAAKCDGLSCNDCSTSFQQTIYTCYSFALFSTEEHQSLSSQTGSFFWERRATVRFGVCMNCYWPPLLFCQCLCCTASEPQPSPSCVFKGPLEINCKIITAVLGSRSNLESAQSSALQAINYQFWSVSMKKYESHSFLKAHLDIA